MASTGSVRHAAAGLSRSRFAAAVPIILHDQMSIGYMTVGTICLALARKRGDTMPTGFREVIE